MEKYGFVYIWYDRKRKRYYIGCHWGTEDDGYICSSRHMRNAYKRRPEDFKRRIIKRLYTNRKDLFLEEYRWLSLIPKEQLGKSYYNLATHPPDHHWSGYEQKYKSVQQQVSNSWKNPELRAQRNMKHSETMKQKFQDPEYRKRYDEGRKKIDYKLFSYAGIAARKNKPSWNKGIPKSDEVKAKISKSLKGRPNGRKGIPLSEAHKLALRKPKTKRIKSNTGE